MLAFLALKAKTEGVFQRQPEAPQGREIGLFDAKPRVVGVGGAASGALWRSTRLRYSSMRSPFAAAAWRGWAVRRQNSFSDSARVKDSRTHGVLPGLCR